MTWVWLSLVGLAIFLFSCVFTAVTQSRMRGLTYDDWRRAFRWLP